MESSRLLLTAKGQEELVRNTHKLALKKRSVLLLLKAAQQGAIAFSELMKKGALPAGELRMALDELIKEEFVQVERQAASTATQAVPVEKAPALFVEGISLSEARFLLNDFCLDIYKTAAPKHVQALSACKSVIELEAFVRKLREDVAAAYPRSVQVLEQVIQEIKETAN